MVLEKKLSQEKSKNFLDNIILASTDKVFRWARSASVWPLMSGLACCAIEMMATFAPRFDIARFGSEIMRPSPRQADLLIVSGTVTKKMAPVLKKLYDQMPEPKYVIAMGSCAISGGPFTDSYSVVKGIDTILPVDVYIAGCPPRPETLILGIMKLKEKILTHGKNSKRTKK